MDSFGWLPTLVEPDDDDTLSVIVQLGHKHSTTTACGERLRLITVIRKDGSPADGVIVVSVLRLSALSPWPTYDVRQANTASPSLSKS